MNKLPHLTDSDLERFWHKVDRREDDECWPWLASLSTSGHGIFRLMNIGTTGAHRVAYTIAYGEIPDGMVVHHECHVRHCVNPKHLRAVTQAENHAVQWNGYERPNRKPIGKLTQPIEVRFWANVDKSGPNGCWLWTGLLTSFGHGSTKYAGRMRPAHRLAWELLRGPIDPGICVCHNCPGGDNPRCVNPDHMFLGTQRDNILDMYRKNPNQPRARGDQHARKKRPGNDWFLGGRNPKRRFSDEQIHEIDRLYAEGMSIGLVARTLEYKLPTVADVIYRRTYQDVPRNHVRTTETSQTRRQRGSESRRALLNESQVADIKKRLAALDKGASLAREYGVSKYVIADIKRGKSWRHVK